MGVFEGRYRRLVEIVRLVPGQLREAGIVLARAFHDDPAWSWVIPRAARREAALPWIFRVAFEVTEGEVWTTSGELRGCARWIPPGPTDVNLGAMVRALIGTPFRVRGAASRFFAYGRAVETIRAESVPEDHWYLAGLGVEPTHWREGVGSALIRPGLLAADEAGLPCALVTNTERNLPFYERHGFTVVSEGQTPAGGPPAWMMRRPPRSPLATLDVSGGHPVA